MEDYWEKSLPLDVAALPNLTKLPSNLLHFDVTLDFESWFLVRDPHKSKKKSEDQDQGDQKDPDAFPRLNGAGHVVNPARSFRGVLRSQAERIASTLNDDAGGDPVRDSSPGIIEVLFGFSGGRTVVHCSQFADPLPSEKVNPQRGLPKSVEEGKSRPLFPREFVAIDRFTGGAAEHLKFDCVAAWQPKLQGVISIDVEDLRKRCLQISKQNNKTETLTSSAALGLLFLTLRDLIEGDLAFGMGAAKGFGQCRGVVSCTLASGDRGTVETVLKGDIVVPADKPTSGGQGIKFAEPWLETLAASCVAAARKWLLSYKKGAR